MRIYLDNAAGTPLDNEVFNAMVPYLRDQFGDPAAGHSHGFDLKLAIENYRDRISAVLKIKPEEVHFTNGGKDEVLAAIESSGIYHLILTGYENAALIENVRRLQKKSDLRVTILKDKDGVIDYHHLEYLLRTNTRNFISIQHLNPVSGQLNDVEKIAGLAWHYKAYLHVDATHTLGKHQFDLQRINFLSAPADRFHGPKGIGLFYHRADTYTKLPAAELCISQIVGLTAALENSYENLERDQAYITGLKSRMRYHLEEFVPDALVVSHREHSQFTSLIVQFPKLFEDKTLQQYLNEQQISVAGGREEGFDLIHFSFSKLNTADEIDHVTDSLTSLFERINY